MDMEKKKDIAEERKKPSGRCVLRKTMAGALSLAVAAGMIPAMPAEVHAEGETGCDLQFGVSGIANPTPWEEGAESWIGNYVYLGQYYNSLDGETGELLTAPLKWRVLNTDSSANLDAEEKGDAVYLLSDQPVDVVESFMGGSENVEVVWENSFVKSFLNGDFLSTAFTDQERNAMVETSGTGPGPYKTGSLKEVLVDVGGCKVFSPSIGEMSDGGFILGKNEIANVFLTNDYLDYRGALAIDGILYNVSTRSVRERKKTMVYMVNNGGGISPVSANADSSVLAAAQLAKEKILFSEPVEGEDGSWELTLEDEGQTLNVTSATYRGDVATIGFDGAPTGENQQVSAIVTDGEGSQILSYEKIADTAENGAGSGTLTLPEGFQENGYKLYVFSECEQPGVLPDYAGTPQEMTLTEGPANVEGITLDKSELSFDKKWAKERLTATITPADADNQNVTWTTSNEQVARVTEKGLVMAVNDGTATITATTEDGGKTATCQVTVKGTGPDQAVISKAQTWGYNGIKVTWDELYGADGYRVYYKSGNSSWKYLTQTGDTSYVHTGVTTGKTYTYYVRGYRNVDGEKVFGSYSKGKEGKAVPRQAKIKKGTAGSKKATLTWDKVNGASGYRIYYKNSENGEWHYVTQIGKGSTTSYTHKNLKSGKTYYYTMRAYRTVNGEKIFGSYSDWKSVKIK